MLSVKFGKNNGSEVLVEKMKMKQIRQETDFDKKSSHEPFAQISPNFKKQKCWTK